MWSKKEPKILLSMEHPLLLDSQTESSKMCLVKVVADNLNYLLAKWFVLVPNIFLAARATAALLDGNHMVFWLRWLTDIGFMHMFRYEYKIKFVAPTSHCMPLGINITVKSSTSNVNIIYKNIWIRCNSCGFFHCRWFLQSCFLCALHANVCHFSQYLTCRKYTTFYKQSKMNYIHSGGPLKFHCKKSFDMIKDIVGLDLSSSYFSEEVWLVGIGRKRSFLFFN